MPAAPAATEPSSPPATGSPYGDILTRTAIRQDTCTVGIAAGCACEPCTDGARLRELAADLLAVRPETLRFLTQVLGTGEWAAFDDLEPEEINTVMPLLLRLAGPEQPRAQAPTTEAP